MQLNATSSMHNTLKSLLISFNIIGLLPLRGISSPRVEDLRFSWRSPKMYFTLFMSLLSFAEVTIMIWVCLHSINFSKVHEYLSAFHWFFTLIAFVNVARKWPKLMKKWKDFGAVEKLKPMVTVATTLGIITSIGFQKTYSYAQKMLTCLFKRVMSALQ